MLHAACHTVYGTRYTVHAACYTQAANTVLKRAGRGMAGEGRTLNRTWPTGCSSSARGSVQRGRATGRGGRVPKRLPANATGYNQEHTRTATANGWMSLLPASPRLVPPLHSHEWLVWAAACPVGPARLWSSLRQGLNLSQRTSAAQELVAHDCARWPFRSFCPGPCPVSLSRLTHGDP